MSLVLDVGGVAVRVTGDERLASVVRRRFGSDEIETTAEIELRFDSGSPAVPGREPDAVSADAELWWDPDALVLRWCGVRATRCGPAVTITVPEQPHDDLLDAVDLLCQYGVAAAVAGPDRAVLHAAALARDGGAVVVVGSSGSGKSSLAAAAMATGWSLLADDLVVVRRTDVGLRVRGVRRPPMLPDELLSPRHAEGPLDDRSRRQLPVGVLLDDERPVVGTVTVGHDPGDGSRDEVDLGDRVAMLVHGLAVPPVPPTMTAHLPMLAALGALPMHRLGHARNAARRSARAAELLDEIGRLVAA